MLLVIGMPRSGTRFVGNLFQIPWEPRFDSDSKSFCRSFIDKDFSREYIKKTFKGEERESNSFLIPHIDAIQELFPKATIIQLVRDPKLVIRSLISNGLMSNDSVDYHNVPLPIRGLDKMSQFEKCCHYWVYTNKMLRKKHLPVIRLEDLRGDSINMRPLTFPSFEDWTKEQKAYFNKVVYPEAKKYGYQKV